MDDKEIIDVPISAIEAFLIVRKTGKCNMISGNEVVNLMNKLGYCEAVSWLLDFNRTTPKVDKEKYMALIKAVDDSFKVMDALTKNE